jgi:small GTP-binding protein
MTTDKHTVRLLLIGDATVGKSSLISCLSAVATSSVPAADGFRPTFNEYRLDLALNGGGGSSSSSGAETTPVIVVDTAGQESFMTVSRNLYTSVHGVAFVFDVTNRATFEHLAEWHSDFAFQAGPEDAKRIARVLFGNKAEGGPGSGERQVSTAEAVELAKAMGVSYAETSSSDAEATRQAFVLLA